MNTHQKIKRRINGNGNGKAEQGQQWHRHRVDLCQKRSSSVLYARDDYVQHKAERQLCLDRKKWLTILCELAPKCKARLPGGERAGRGRFSPPLL